MTKTWLISWLENINTTYVIDSNESLTFIDEEKNNSCLLSCLLDLLHS